MLDRVTADEFRACLQQTFCIHLGDGQTVDAELIEVTSLGAASRGTARREPFSLVFRGPKDALLQQQMFKVVHSALGELDIFLVPIGPDDVGMRLEAIFT